MSSALGAVFAAAAIVAYAPGALAALTLDDARRLALEGRPAAERPQVRHEVTAAWLSAWSASRKTKLERALLAEYRRGVEAATVSVSAGRGTLAEVYAARQFLYQAEDRLLQLRQHAEQSAADLERWTGQAGATPAEAAPRWAEPRPLAELLARLASIKDADARRARQAELKAAYSEWRLAGERLANFDGRILPDAQARIEALSVKYAAGTSDLSPMFEARQALAESRVRRAAIEEARVRARARIEAFEQVH